MTREMAIHRMRLHGERMFHRGGVNKRHEELYLVYSHLVESGHYAQLNNDPLVAEAGMKDMSCPVCHDHGWLGLWAEPDEERLLHLMEE